MKYNLGVQTVEAVYDNSGTQNPLIVARLPPRRART